MPGCEEGVHNWTARFYRGGSLAFWFCSRCGETDREVENLPEPLESPSGIEDHTVHVTLEGSEPAFSHRSWRLPEGSMLMETEPASREFMGRRIPGLPESCSYVLRKAADGGVREFRPSLDRSSDIEGHFILTRYAVQGEKLVKYRISCRFDPDSGQVEIGDPVGVAVLYDLAPLR